MPDVPRPTDDRWRRWRIRAVLLRKEWQEHRWRFMLATVVLSALLAGLLRANILPHTEATMLIYWPVGVILTVFLAMGTMAAERGQQTWPFLTAQPVPRSTILTAKWCFGLVQLGAMILIATGFGFLAMWSRGFYGWRVRTAGADDVLRSALRGDAPLWLVLNHPGIWLWYVAVVALVALSCWYTLLFMVFLRARNEYMAALAGILLNAVVHLWLLQNAGIGLVSSPWLHYAGAMNPLAVLLFSAAIAVPGERWILLLVPLHVVLWIVLPVWLLRRRTRKAVIA